MGPCGTRAGSFFNLNAGVLVWFQCALDVSKDKQSLKLETVCRLFVPLCQETLAAKLQTSQLRLARATLSSRFKVKIISLAPSETPWRRIAVKNASSSATCPQTLSRQSRVSYLSSLKHTLCFLGTPD